MVPDKAMEFGIWWDLEFPIQGRRVPAGGRRVPTVHQRGASKREKDMEWVAHVPKSDPTCGMHSGPRGSGRVPSRLRNVPAQERQAGSHGVTWWTDHCNCSLTWPLACSGPAPISTFVVEPGPACLASAAWKHGPAASLPGPHIPTLPDQSELKAQLLFNPHLSCQ